MHHTDVSQCIQDVLNDLKIRNQYRCIEFIFNKKKIITNHTFITLFMKLYNIYSNIYNVYKLIYVNNDAQVLTNKFLQTVINDTYVKFDIHEETIFDQFYTLYYTTLESVFIPTPLSRTTVIHNNTAELTSIVSKYGWCYFEGIIHKHIDTTFVAKRYYKLCDTKHISIATKAQIMRFMAIQNHYPEKSITLVSHKYLISSNDTQLRFWNLNTNECECILFNTKDIVYKVGLGTQIIIKSESGLIVFNFMTGKHTYIPEQDIQNYTPLSGNRIATSFYGGIVKIDELILFENKDLLVDKITEITNDTIMIQGHYAHNHKACIEIWNLQNQQRDFIVEDDVIDTHLYPKIITFGHRQGLKMWNHGTYETCIHEYIGIHWLYINNNMFNCFISNDLLLGVSPDHKSLIAYNIHTSKEQFSLPHEHEINDFIISKDYKIITECKNNTLRVWDSRNQLCEMILTDQKEIDTLNNVTDKAFVITRNDYKMELWSVYPLKLISENFTSYKLLPDGQLLTGCATCVVIWDLDTLTYRTICMEGAKDILCILDNGHVIIKHLDMIKIWK